MCVCVVRVCVRSMCVCECAWWMCVRTRGSVHVHVVYVNVTKYLNPSQPFPVSRSLAAAIPFVPVLSYIYPDPTGDCVP